MRSINQPDSNSKSKVRAGKRTAWDVGVRYYTQLTRIWGANGAETETETEIK